MGNNNSKQHLPSQGGCQVNRRCKQCPKCNFGPVAGNHCANCGFHTMNHSKWKTWDDSLPATALFVVPEQKPPSPPQRTRALTAGVGSQANLNNLRPRSATAGGDPRSVHFYGPASGGFTPTLANLGPNVYDPRAEQLALPPETYRPRPAIGGAGGVHMQQAGVLPPQYQDPQVFAGSSLSGSFGSSPNTMGPSSMGGGGYTNPSTPSSGGGHHQFNEERQQQFQAPPPPPPANAHPNSGGAPLKYTKGSDGIRRINPAYLAFHTHHNPQAAKTTAGTVAGMAVSSTSVLYPQSALAVCSSMDEYSCYFQDAPLAPATDDAISRMQEQPQLPQRVGLQPDTIADELGKILAKYEAPIGMMPKLMELSDFDLLEFIVDDSGSMNLDSDVRSRYNGSFLTRWEEVKARIETMFEILSCVATPPISIVFLNGSEKILLRQGGFSQSPAAFIAEGTRELNRVWTRGASGRTPAFEAIQRSFLGREQQAVCRYFFGDGEPNGGRSEEQNIGRYLKARALPARNPFTFMSCTDNDAQTEWMKDVEEISPFCAEYDDFLAEAREVARDHGNALPYSLGMHLVGQLVGALNPHDLDALDESVPLTKTTLDNLLGFRHTEQEYRHYFTNFTSAQRSRVIRTPADRLRKETNWDPQYKLFVQSAVSADIRLVRDYTTKLRHFSL